jgi:hypothetical protein
MIPKRAAAPRETNASTTEEVRSMILVLENAGERRACLAIAMMFFAGLRPRKRVEADILGAAGMKWHGYGWRT